MELPNQPTELDKAIREVELEERALAAERLLQISAQLADLATLAKALVEPVDLPARSNDI